jgi:DNA-binding transcriptional LysR family regulator
MGISSRRIDHRDLEYKDFFSDEVILIAPADHRWADYRQIYPDDLLDEPMILREEAAGTREVMKKGLLEHDISFDMLNVAMGLGNAEAIEMAVEEGIGVAFISRLAAARGLELGCIVEVEVVGMKLYRKIYLARNQKYPTTRAQSEFWEFVHKPEVEMVNHMSTPLPNP